MILLINYSHKWWYKALSVLLVIALIIAISFGATPRVHAVGVLTITICAAILAVMAGAGIATVVSGMTSADIQNWMTGKLNEWDTYRNDGNVFTDLIQNNLITTTVKGALAIGNGAARGISDFITWLKNDLGLQNNSSQVVYSTGGIQDIYTVSFSGNGTYSINDNSFYLYCSQINGLAYLNFVAASTIQWATISFVANCHRNQGQNTIVAFEVPSDINNPKWIDLSNAVNCQKDNGTVFMNGNGDFIASGTVTIHNSNRFSIRTSSYAYVTITMADFVIDNQVIEEKSFSLDSDVINIPSVEDDGQTDIVIGIDGVYPGATTDEAADVIMDGVLDNTLDTTMTVTDEYVDAVEAVVINEQPISVNTDHHMIGFTNLPDFVNLNLNSIWHYVSDAVEYASGFISWFVNLLSSVPTLAIPLYMSFTLLIVLSFIRRILL